MNILRINLDRLPAVRERQFLLPPLPIDIRQHTQGPGSLRKQRTRFVLFLDGLIGLRNGPRHTYSLVPRGLLQKNPALIGSTVCMTKLTGCYHSVVRLRP